jgi:hypothetical protein
MGFCLRKNFIEGKDIMLCGQIVVIASRAGVVADQKASEGDHLFRLNAAPSGMRLRSVCVIALP